MPNPTIKSITLPSGTTYDLKDETARNAISGLSGAMKYVGVTTTVLTDGSTATTIVINGDNHTAAAGDVAIYGDSEFVFNGSTWNEFGSTGSLKALAFKDSASGSYTPAGSVSQPTFSGSSMTSTGKFTPSGSVSAPAISVNQAGSTTTVNSITDVGTLPSLTTTVTNEVLTIGFNQGTLPTKGSNTTVKTGDASYTASQPTFTGTEDDVSVSGTPAGSVTQPTFSGTAATITVS